jgi:hypothetical protein
MQDIKKLKILYGVPRAWNAAARRNPSEGRPNPFASMELLGSNRETSTVSFAELKSFRKTAIVHRRREACPKRPT